MKTLTLLLASVTCCVAAAPAIAAKGSAPLTVTGAKTEDPATIRVAYGDLSLTSAADAGVLRERVKRAARRTCGALYGSALLSQEWACQDIAWRVASPQIAAAIARAGSGQNLAAAAVVLRFARH